MQGMHDERVKTKLHLSPHVPRGKKNPVGKNPEEPLAVGTTLWKRDTVARTDNEVQVSENATSVVQHSLQGAARVQRQQQPLRSSVGMHRECGSVMHQPQPCTINPSAYNIQGMAVCEARTTGSAQCAPHVHVTAYRHPAAAANELASVARMYEHHG